MARYERALRACEQSYKAIPILHLIIPVPVCVWCPNVVESGVSNRDSWVAGEQGDPPIIIPYVFLEVALRQACLLSHKIMVTISNIWIVKSY